MEVGWFFLRLPMVRLNIMTYTNRSFYFTTFSLYDNKKSSKYARISSMGIYVMETIEVWQGSWKEKAPQKSKFKNENF